MITKIHRHYYLAFVFAFQPLICWIDDYKVLRLLWLWLLHNWFQPLICWIDDYKASGGRIAQASERVSTLDLLDR